MTIKPGGLRRAGFVLSHQASPGKSPARFRDGEHGRVDIGGGNAYNLYGSIDDFEENVKEGCE